MDQLLLFAAFHALFIILLSLVLCIICRKKQYYKKFKVKTIFIFVLEWVLSTLFILVSLHQISQFYYYSNLNIISSISIVLLGGVLISYIYLLFLKFRDSLEMIAVIFLIPIGLMFLFGVLPDYVPDEQAHFQRAYAVSNFRLDASLDVAINSDYGIKKFSDFKDIFSYFYIDNNPSYAIYHEACSYNFLLYILPSIGLLIGRFFHFSLYICYYLGRMCNLALFIFFAYQSIHIIPKGKLIYSIFYFNPMLLHLAASYSADAMILSLCLYAIAYFFYLYNRKPTIHNKDIAIIISLIFIIAVSKVAYLPLFGIYFAYIPTLVKMDKNRWLFLASCVVLGFIYVLISLKLQENAGVIASQAKYYKEANVDANRQIQFILSNPSNLYVMFKHTFHVKIMYYFETFISRLGWLEIYINIISFVGYNILLFVSVFIDKVKLNIGNRVWFFFVGLAIAAIVTLGLYLYWTPVGWLTAEGVQGRYFIPCAILFLLAISNGWLSKLYRYKSYFIVLALGINLLVVLDILNYFI